MSRAQTPQTARELAQWLIYPYVARGDDFAWIRSGGMGYAGRVGDVHIHLDHIIVERLGPYPEGMPVEEHLAQYTGELARFLLKDIWREVEQQLHAQVMQPSLFR